MPVKFPCSICCNPVKTNQNSIFCNCCKLWTHLKCTNLNLIDYFKLANDEENWLCPECLSTALPLNWLDSEEFDLMISDLDQSSNYCLNLKTITDLNLDSLKLPIDEDLESSDSRNSCYYSLNNFIDVFNHDPVQNVSFMHLNIRSLCKHIDQFKAFLHSITHNISVIGLTETWLNASSCKNLLNIPGYILINKNRVGRIGGGVALYISNDLQYTPRLDLNDIGGTSFECIFIEIITPHNAKNIVIGVVYKAPDAKTFLLALKHYFTN